MKVYKIIFVNDNEGNPTDQIQFDLIYILNHQKAEKLFEATKVEKKDKDGKFILNA